MPAHHPPSRATVSTVAAAAGVSTATVSRVMSGALTVNADLAARVRRAAEEVGYHPNSAARVLASGMHRCIAVVIPDAANPYFLEVIKSVLLSAAGEGYRTLVADSQGDPIEELSISRSLVGTVDGLILLSSRISADGLREIPRWGIPTVLVNRRELGVEIPMVAIDNFSAMLALCGHLAELGHKRVAYLGGSPLAWQNQERWRAVQQAAVLGLEATLIEGDGSIEAGRLAAASAIMQDVTALVCFNDLAAIGAISLLREEGLRVPQDISVTGFDDIALARYGDLRLTTARTSRADLGRQAWDLLHGKLVGEKTDLAMPLLKAEVIIGESTGVAATVR
ncbi:MAG: LacI family DNA-binding transcriptional regulator [Nocardioides sp.]|uniref:LacI family DNA-binding transcriptional regulator n=1 Tax=Nocardioides sp. TaxID=35761 RepID=UPI0039E5560D